MKYPYHKPDQAGEYSYAGNLPFSQDLQGLVRTSPLGVVLATCRRDSEILLSPEKTAKASVRAWDIVTLSSRLKGTGTNHRRECLLKRRHGCTSAQRLVTCYLTLRVACARHLSLRVLVLSCALRAAVSVVCSCLFSVRGAVCGDSCASALRARTPQP